MRVLLLLRGAPGCGKSTWIKDNGLIPYTLSSDEIRLLCQSPVLTPNGSEAISQDNDKIAWKVLFELLEVRMQRGEFTVIDATNTKTAEINRYKDLCEAYRYRMYCVDFTDVPIEECKRRNAQRIGCKVVPEAAIDKAYSRFATQKIPSKVKVIKPNELDTIWYKTIDVSDYKSIYVIGDVHGCNTAFQEYLNGIGGIKDDCLYVFVGDYIDRGMENGDFLSYIMAIAEKPNVMVLEGNHERNLYLWANDCTGKTKEFELITKAQLEEAKISKKDVRQFYRRLGQCAYFTYHDKTFLITHGGLSYIPDNLTTVATDQIIKGVGSYNEVELAEQTFCDNTPDNFIQIHGHRNPKNLPVKVNDKCYNLEGKVEFGGYLRCVTITPDSIETVETKNDVFKAPEIISAEKEMKASSVSDVLIALRSSRFVEEKKFDNISSFNFKREAFYDKIWNEQTTKARGLYIDTTKAKVVARAYEKFFNINERPETKFDILQHKLQFPITAYVKENGFLGIVSYNEYTDDFFITTKSNPDGDYAGYLKDIFYAKTTEESRKKMLDYIKEFNVSFVFECVDMKNDPHIIEYTENKLFLLDVVNNDIEFKKLPYEDLCKLGQVLGLEVKKLGYIIQDWQEFFDWYYIVLEEDYTFNGEEIEGFVIEDMAGYMVKLKLFYYNFWKFMRGLSHEVLRRGYTTKTSALTTPLANNYYGFIKGIYENTDSEQRKLVPKDIISLRNMYYKEQGKEG